MAGIREKYPCDHNDPIHRFPVPGSVHGRAPDPPERHLHRLDISGLRIHRSGVTPDCLVGSCPDWTVARRHAGGDTGVDYFDLNGPGHLEIRAAFQRNQAVKADNGRKTGGVAGD